jgi:hypothetical protein
MRITAAHAMEHPWLKTADSMLVTRSLEKSLMEFKIFHAQRKVFHIYVCMDIYICVCFIYIYIYLCLCVYTFSYVYIYVYIRVD